MIFEGGRMIKKTLVLFCFCLMLVLSSVSLSGTNIFKCENAELNPYENYDGTLSGYVTDEDTNPIEGALIRVNFHETYEENYSDEDGFYFVENIPICYCYKNVSCSKDGYKTEYVEMPIYENSTYDFVLEYIGGTLEIDGDLGENGWYVSGIWITFSYDPSIIEPVYFQIDDGDWILYTEPLYYDEPGEHTLCYYYVLVGGGTSTTSTFEFRIDCDPPVISDVDVEKINSDTYRISRNVHDDVSGIDYVEFYLDDDLQDIDSVAPYEAEITIAEKGTYQVGILVYDIAGNACYDYVIIERSRPVLRNIYILTFLKNLFQRFNLLF